MSLPNPGNSVADYQEVRKHCVHCASEGVVPISHDELRDYINNADYTFRRVRLIVRFWRSTDGMIICDECNGRGSWIIKV